MGRVAIPQWSLAPSPPKTLQRSKSDDFEILIDRSEPMGGYFEGTQEDGSIFPDMFRNTYSILNSQYGTGTCFGVGTTVTRFDCGETIGQRFFNGVNSEIHTAFDRVLERLQAGTLEAAVLISDFLITKNGHFLGAPGLLDNPDTRELLLSGLDSRKLDLALLGIPLHYHGVSRSGYDGRWWFNDCGGQYERLQAPVYRPLYVLIIGSRPGNIDAIRKIALRLRDIVENLDSNVDVVRQTFSAPIRSGTVKWGEVRRGRPLLYFGEEAGSYRCERRGLVETSSDGSIFPPTLRISSVRVTPVSEKWIEVGRELRIKIHCDGVEDILDGDDTRDTLSARLEMTLTRQNTSWNRLSSTTCKPDRTYGLDYLIDILQPSSYRAQSAPFVITTDR